MSTQKLGKLYQKLTGVKPERVEKITGSGSNRQYYRLHGPVSLIGVTGTDFKENAAFIYLTLHFEACGLNVPQIVAIDADNGCYLQEDLGTTSLFDYISGLRCTGIINVRERLMLDRTLKQLAAVQFLGNEELDYQFCYPVAEFDRTSIMWDLNYFKYCFLRNSGVEVNEPALEADFHRLADALLDRDGMPYGFMYRDFQSRNVMVHNDEPYFIDYQGGRYGPVAYDIASFLWQARANFPDHIRAKRLEYYLKCASKYIEIDRLKFLAKLQLFVFFRMLQVLGAYGLRGIVERKAHFLNSIPGAIKNIIDLPDSFVFQEIRGNSSKTFLDDYPEIKRIVKKLDNKPDKANERTSLLVTVMSFSYKMGLPEDSTGNGGGFLFDCRGMHNPGRYFEYRKITGRDKPVIKFLEERGEVQPFMEHSQALVDASVETYLRRGFTNLFVGFGCTGGQHRSVYCAEKMARHLNDKYGVEVKLVHREQNYSHTFRKRSND